MEEELWEDYLQHLIWVGHLGKFRGYENLFELLQNIEFTWLIERDENRAGDGLELRDDYEFSIDITDSDNLLVEDFMNCPCSVLEMLIGLAIRVDEEYLGDPADPHPEDFFWEMIKNLDLDCFTNRILQKRSNVDVLQARIRIWLKRRFAKNGLGSPFPVYNDDRNQRDLEIWDQMNSYINENYG